MDMPDILIIKLISFLKFGLSSLLILSCASISCASFAQTPNKLNINLPAGFEISVFAKNLQSPRMMAFDKNGNLFVSSNSTDQVFMLPDVNKDGVAEATVLVSDQLNAPNGLVFLGEDLLVANQNGVVKLTQNNGKWSAPSPFVKDLPAGHHTVKTIKIGPDQHLYINVGSSCNVCAEDDPLRATILRYTLDAKPAGGKDNTTKNAEKPIWAQGLRNSQGFAWHPKTNTMYATNNGSDMRSLTKNGKVSDEIPPEHINEIVAGKHYGWPYCWADNKNPATLMQDPNFVANVNLGGADFCQTATPPVITVTSHSTPIGITFLDKTNWPTEFKTDAIVALHGSWNRQQLSGYKLVRLVFKDNKPIQVVDFATGWLNNNQAWGRPVDAITGPDGALYVSDDRAGYIYKITHH